MESKEGANKEPQIEQANQPTNKKPLAEEEKERTQFAEPPAKIKHLTKKIEQEDTKEEEKGEEEDDSYELEEQANSPENGEEEEDGAPLVPEDPDEGRENLTQNRRE